MEDEGTQKEDETDSEGVRGEGGRFLESNRKEGGEEHEALVLWHKLQREINQGSPEDKVKQTSEIKLEGEGEREETTETDTESLGEIADRVVEGGGDVVVVGKLGSVRIGEMAEKLGVGAGADKNMEEIVEVGRDGRAAGIVLGLGDEEIAVSDAIDAHGMGVLIGGLAERHKSEEEEAERNDDEEEKFLERPRFFTSEEVGSEEKKLESKDN